MARTIKSVLLAVLMCSLFCGCGKYAMQVSQDDVEAIRKLSDDFCTAHKFNDGAKLAEFYTNDALLIPPNEPIVCGKKAIAEWYQRQLKKAPPIENPKVILEEIEVFGNLAFNRGYFILKFEGETTDKPIIQNLRCITIWRKQPDGNWKFYCDTWNTNAPLPRAP